MVCLTVLYTGDDDVVCLELNKISKAWWNQKTNTLVMGYGYGMTADLIGFARAKKHGITLDMDQLDAIVTMIKKRGNSKAFKRLDYD